MVLVNLLTRILSTIVDNLKDISLWRVVCQTLHNVGMKKRERKPWRSRLRHAHHCIQAFARLFKMASPALAGNRELSISASKVTAANI